MSQRESGNPEEASVLEMGLRKQARPGGAGASLRAMLRVFLGLPTVRLPEAGLEGSGCRLDLLVSSPRRP